ITNPAGSLTALYSVGKSAIIGLELQALQTENKGRVISSPRIMTADRQEATIEQGTEIPYQEASSSGATSTSFKKAVLSLNVKPQITPDNHVMLDIKVNKDSVSPTLTVGGTPALDTKKVNTQVLVENGGTVVIGGIYQQQISDIVNKVPLLGDIPILGALFRSSQKYDNRTELLVFITPRVVDDLSGNNQ
ncbi:type IV pilus secretin PilQ, partial [Pseudomonas sp. MWU13-2860]